MDKKVFFNDSHGHKICAILTTPSKPTNKIIVMCHGLNSGKDSKSNVEMEKIFLAHNIATFRIDMFGHGESDGSKEERNLDEFVNSIYSAFEFVKSEGYLNIGVYGASFGAVSTIIACTKFTNIKVVGLRATGMGQNSRKMDNYKKDFENKTWIKAGKKIKIPTILVHGTADEDVEFEFGKELANAIQGSKFISIDGANHSFTKKEDFDKMIKEISNFIIKNIA